MKVDQKEQLVIIKDTQGDLAAFITKITDQHKTFENQNIVINLLAHKTISINDIKLFASLMKVHKKNKKSFVIVAEDLDYNAVPDQFTVVPSLLEAHDIIEMEEIERDLGF